VVVLWFDLLLFLSVSKRYVVGGIMVGFVVVVIRQ